MNGRAVSVIAIVLIALVACGGEGGSTSSLSIRDSEGDTLIIPVEGPLFSASEGTSPRDWAISHVGGAVVFGDGASVVAESSERLLIAFDSVGEVSHVVGGRGQGPGEFGGAPVVVRSLDGVGGYDLLNRRFSVFREGRLWLDFPMTEWPRTLIPIGWLPDAGLLFRLFVEIGGQPREYLVADSTGAGRGSIRGPVPPTHGGERITGYGICAPMLHEATIGNTLYIADAGAGTLTAMDLDGRVDLFYTEESRRLVTAEIRLAVEGDLLRRFGQSAELAAARGTTAAPPPLDEIQAYLDFVGMPGVPLAAWGAMVADPELGVLLLQETRCPVSSAAFGEDRTLWTIVDTAGVRLGRISTPPMTQVKSAAGGWLLLVRQGELMVEYAELYRLPAGVWNRR